MLAARAGIQPSVFLTGAVQKEVLTPQKFSAADRNLISVVRNEYNPQEGRLVCRHHPASTSPISNGFSPFLQLPCFIFGCTLEKKTQKNTPKPAAIPVRGESGGEKKL